MFYLPGVAKTLDAWFYARAFRRALRSLCSARRPDLIDAHFEWPDGVGAWYVARELGVPFVCTLRGKLVSRISEPGMFRRLREMLLGADGLVAVSRSLADLARTVAGRDLAIRVIPNGIDGEIFNGLPDAAEANRPSSTARRQLGWSVEGRYVVSVAHLQELKGWHRLIEAWPMVRRRMGDVRLILVGDRAGELNYERRLQAMLKGVNGAGLLSVQLIGRVQSKMVATLLNAADLFALTSCSEGWCNAIAEALACGCPVLATDVGGNREIIAGDETGFLVPVDEPSALIEGLCRALSRRWNRSQIARMGGRRNWQQVAVECVDVFKEVLERRERQR